MFSDIFMPLEENTLAFTMFLQRQGPTSSKTSLFTLLFCECVENTVFCDVFSTRGFTCTANTTVLFIFYFQFSKQTSQEHWYLQCFTRQTCKKTRCFETIFHNFPAGAPPFKKRSFFTLFLPPLIRTQEGVKSEHIVKPLPQRCNTKN